jgi:hypothetical protein
MGNIVGGAIEGITGKGAAKDASKASKAATDLTKAQARQLQLNEPTLNALRQLFSGQMNQVYADSQAATQRAAQFDPAMETQRAMEAFDMAQKDSIRQNLEGNQAHFLDRGFTKGNAPSQASGADQEILGRAANERGQFAANLKMRETDRRDEIAGRAGDFNARAFSLLDPTGRTISQAGALQGAANTQMGIAQGYQNQAANANPGALIPIMSDAVKGIKWPWQKQQGQNTTNLLGNISHYF